MLWLQSGGIIASFLFVITTGLGHAATTSDLIAREQTIDQAIIQQLDQQRTWHALLHLDQDTPRITDPSFLLSQKHGFSPKQELLLTLQALLDPVTAAQTYCRFPARASWLAQQLRIPLNPTDCPDLNEFLAKAPADQIDLIYASENLYSASSMMGHVLLKISGLNDQKQPVAHAVSFYTEVKGFNLPKILYDSTIVGKKGYFALSPYSEKHAYYAEKEQRNIWTYTLNLTPAQRHLIQLHLWELRQTELTYFFHTYNCATFTNLILAIADHPTLSASHGWVSPLDTVKLIHAAGLVSATTVAPSSRAMVRVLTENQSLNWRNDFKTQVQNGNLPTKKPAQSAAAYAEVLLAAQYYAQYLSDQQRMSAEQRQRLVTASEDQLEQLIPDYLVDFSGYKTPNQLPNDSQIYVGITKLGSKHAIRLGGFAASHALVDDNRQRMSENQLRIADVSVLMGDDPEPYVRLDQFSLYNMASYLPYDPLTGGWSVAFSMGYDPLYDAQLVRGHATQIKAGVGLSYKPWSDLTLYLMTHAAAAYNRQDSGFVYVEPQAGIMLNTLYSGKTLIQFNAHHSVTGRDAAYMSTTMTQAFRLNPQLSVVFDYQRYWQNRLDQSEWSLTLKHLF